MTHYSDFKLVFAPKTPNTFRVTAESYDGAKAHGIYTIPEVMRRGQANRAKDSRNITVLQETPSEKVVLTDQNRGELLFRSLFQGDVGSLFQQYRKRPLRLKFIFEAPGKRDDGPEMTALYSLPWELLYDRDFLAQDNHYSIVRDVDGQAPRLARLPLRLNAFLIAANPYDTRTLDLKREADGIKRGAFFSRIKLHFWNDTNHLDLYRISEKGFHVLHFMGHGECSGEEAAIFLQNAEGEPCKLTSRSFVRVILGMEEKKKPQLVVLNACEGSATVAGQEGLEGMAANLIREGVPAVVAMREEISDHAAIAFSGAFYRKLDRTGTLDEAVLAGRQAIAASKQPDDWSLPVLYSNLPGGRMTRRLHPLRALLGLAAIFTLAWCWYGFQNRVILADPAWANEVLSGANEDRYYALVEARGLNIGSYPIGRELRLVAHENEILGNVRYRFFSILGSTQSFSVARGTHLPGDPQDLAALALVQRLAWRTLDLLGRKTEDLEAGYRGLGFLEIGDLDAAEKCFRQALAHNPDFAEAHNNLAVLLWAQARFDEALNHARTAWEQAPGVAAFAFNLGRILIDSGDSAAATDLFRGYAWKSGHKGVLNELGKLLTAERQWSEATLAFKICLEADPHFSAAKKNLARLYLDSGRLDLAEPLLRQALEEVEGDSGAKSTLLALQVRCYNALTRPQDACAAWTQLAKEPGNAGPTDLQAAFETALDLGCDLTQEQPTPQTSAVLLSCRGQVSLFAAGTGEKPAWPRTAITHDQELRLGLHATATLVTPEDRIFSLVGEATWNGKERPVPHFGTTVPGFYATVISGLEKSSGTLGQVLQTASKGDASLTILAPRNWARSQDEIAWTALDGVGSYRLTVAEELGWEESVEFQADSFSGAICRTSWPWPDRRPSPQTSLIIIVTASGKMGITESSIDITVIEKEQETQLGLALGNLDGVVKDLSTLHLARAEIMGNFGLAGGLILERFYIYHQEQTPETELALCEALMGGGLPRYAISRFASMEQDSLTALHRTRTQEIWGRALMALGERQAAEEHLARARALYTILGETERAKALIH